MKEPSAVYFISRAEAKKTGVREWDVTFIALQVSRSPHFFFTLIKDSLYGAFSFFAFLAELVNKEREPDISRFIRLATFPIFFVSFNHTKSNTKASNISSVGSDIPFHSERTGVRLTMYFSKVSL